jgi:hypothetical protein
MGLLSDLIPQTGNSTADALIMAGETTLGQAIQPAPQVKPASSPTATVIPTPGTAASPVGDLGKRTVSLPFVGSVTYTVLGAVAIGGLLLLWWHVRRK